MRVKYTLCARTLLKVHFVYSHFTVNFELEYCKWRFWVKCEYIKCTLLLKLLTELTQIKGIQQSVMKYKDWYCKCSILNYSITNGVLSKVGVHKMHFTQKFMGRMFFLTADKNDRCENFRQFYIEQKFKIVIYDLG